MRTKLRESPDTEDGDYYEKLYSTDALIIGYKRLYDKYWSFLEIFKTEVAFINYVY